MGKAPNSLGITRSQEATVSDPVSRRSFGGNLCMRSHFQETEVQEQSPEELLGYGVWQRLESRHW